VQATFNILHGIALVVAVGFALLIFITGKGDAMGGSSGIRTTFKGKAGFDDFVSKTTLILGISFMALTLLLDVISSHMNPGHGV
jgi:preprotein translocase subunit SecG